LLSGEEIEAMPDPQKEKKAVAIKVPAKEPGKPEEDEEGGPSGVPEKRE